MILALVLSAVVSPALASAPRPLPYRAPDRYDNITLPLSRISHRDLIIDDISAFARGHGPAATHNNTSLRRAPVTYDEIRKARLLYIKCMEMTKQAMYLAQDRLKYLQGILKKYQNDQTFRAGFIFTKLNQLVEDMRRIHAYVYKKYDYRTVYRNIFYYRHVTKKNVDVTYIVEYMYTFHAENKRMLQQYQDQFTRAADVVSEAPDEK